MVNHPQHIPTCRGIWEEVVSVSLWIAKDSQWIWADFFYMDSHSLMTNFNRLTLQSVKIRNGHYRFDRMQLNRSILFDLLFLAAICYARLKNSIISETFTNDQIW